MLITPAVTGIKVTIGITPIMVVGGPATTDHVTGTTAMGITGMRITVIAIADTEAMIITAIMMDTIAGVTPGHAATNRTTISTVTVRSVPGSPIPAITHHGHLTGTPLTAGRSIARI